jgi:multiple sugar transport system ATP-binding protein
LRVIDKLSLDVRDGEFLVLLGPSGCGKSTLLRMLAGLEPVTEGEIAIDERRVEREPPGQRDIAFVFQSYALYPHLTVKQNISFPLVMKRFRWWMHLPLVGRIMRRRIERDPAVSGTTGDVARLLGLTGLMDRLPRTLSGGQRQRVALGRAMVRQPAVFLMDEPLSNLDAKLRTSMRAEIARLHARLGGTFVYVTHDQVEAMTMGTRIALMRAGVIQQIGTPRELFQDPANTFVARFIGTPPMNLIHAELNRGTLRMGEASYDWPGGAGDTDSKAVILGVRPGGLSLDSTPSPHSTPGVVLLVEHLGTHSIVGVQLDSVMIRQDVEQDDNSIMISVNGYSALKVDQRVHVSVDTSEAILFDAETGARMTGIASAGRADLPFVTEQTLEGRA